ncbi:MAG: GNAT family N-acetyltransferase [Planctomycetota bacterium]|jgi:ribosomal protein S18 acetylase RimI-like enzyme
MIVRRYKPGEENEIWSVYYGSTRNVVSLEYTPDQVKRWAPDDLDMEPWAARLARTKPFVAILDDKIVGFAELEPDGHINYIYCHHEFQRQGIGSELWEAVEREAERLGLEEIFAEVSTTGIDFFLAKGFQIEEEMNNIVCGEPAKQYRVRKKRT